ncbi:MAG TPA: SdpI family protein [Puia sp.]|nr:SdpI family protein [Puia sp.]
MKKNSLLLNTLVIVLISLPLLYLAITYNSLPATVPLHFNSSLEADRTGDKSELWIPVLVLAGVALLVFFLLNNLHRFDPKRKEASSSSTFNKLAAGLAFLITALNFLTILSASKGASVIKHFLFPLLGLLFAFLGNYMNNIKPNYFAGFRLPWTLSDDENWRKTHHLAGKLWFWTGITIAVISLFISSKILLPYLTTLVALICIIPAIYSYRLFKSKQ